MTKEIKIGRYPYEIQYSPEVAQQVLDKIVKWMNEHPSAHSGEGICQNDECLIDAPELIASIVDRILKPVNLDPDDDF